MRNIILADFSDQLATGGTPVTNTTTGATFRALVVASNENATFELGDQQLADSASATCFREEAPTTGDILEIEGAHWIVAQLQTRPGSPVARFYMQLQTASDYDDYS